MKDLISIAEKTRAAQKLYDTTIEAYEREAKSVEPDAKQAKRLAAIEKFKQQLNRGVVREK